MKKFIVMLVLSLTACTSAGNSETPPVSITPLSNPSSVPASATPFQPTETAIPSPAPTQAASQPWWNDAIFYEIDVRSFYDSNSDGIGDFQGLIEKLDYLNDGDPSTNSDLGITGIWLKPIHPSPSTHGYDVTDYYAVNPQYGTIDEFRRLVDEAHQRGIHVIIDLVINHTSNQHPWFIQSRDANSPYRDWYLWADVDPGWKGEWGNQVWYPLNDDYYYAVFWEGMPDLNYKNPAVTAEMQNVTRFWLADVGIDGFRLDAIPSLIEIGTVTANTKDSHGWFADYYQFYKGIKPDAMTIGEVWSGDAEAVPWVANQEVDLAFEFDLAFAMLESINDGNSARMLATLKSGTRRFPKGQYGTFLANHDMHRVMDQLGGNPEKAKAAASLYFSLPGVPFLYYGEELGMSEDGLLRVPMQWSGERYAGFSDVRPWETPDHDYPIFNVEAETGDPESILSHYRTLISLRNSHSALRIGELFLITTSNPGLFACLRTTADEFVLVIVNLTNTPIRDYELSVSANPLSQGEYAAVSLMDEITLTPLTIRDKGWMSNYVPVAEIPPYATIMIQLKSK